MGERDPTSSEVRPVPAKSSDFRSKFPNMAPDYARHARHHNHNTTIISECIN